MVMDLARRGLPEWLIAQRLRISHRTVQRYKRQERQGIIPRTYPPGFGCSKPLCPLHKPGALADEMVSDSSSDTRPAGR